MTSQMREFDIVVFGATGFTGQFIVEKLAVVGAREQLKWAIAGRNQLKLQECLSEAAKQLKASPDAVKDTPIIIADVQNEESLREMCKRTRLVLNCVGPYVDFGEPVVKACLASGTDHLDVSGEIGYMDMLLSRYNEAAEKAGVLLLSACGFDSVPVEATMHYTEQQLGEGLMSDAEAYLELRPGRSGYALHTGTLQSLVDALKRDEVEALPQLAECEREFPESAFRPKKRGLLHHKTGLDAWAVEFLGCDRLVVCRTQRTLLRVSQRRPVRVALYMRGGSLFRTLGLACSMLHLLVMSKCARSLLLRHPKFFTMGFFSHKGPSRLQMAEASFTYTVFARGWRQAPQPDSPPDRRIRLALRGHDYGYITTAVCAVEAAVTVLKERSRILVPGGAVTVGAALRNTEYFERLLRVDDGFSFEMQEL